LVKSHRAPIFAFVDGEVIHARLGQSGTGFGGFGNVVAIKDKNDYLHCYAHLDSISVRLGQKVVSGQEVGKQGTTGRSTGSHLHYEVRSKSSPSFGFGKDVDPSKYLDSFKIKPATEEIKTAKIPVFIENKKCNDGLLINGITFVHVRDLAETYGGKLEWANKNLKVNGTTVGSARLINNSNYAPVRDIAAILKVQVQWNGKEVRLHK
jgi:murein DD-endopeptidase MepM/ murein hydrolase activator NlpD